MGVDGILNVLKPPGRTSFQVVSLVRRWSGEKRVGHTGTLDPEASGVLILGLGQGTRVIEFLSQSAKTYHAVIELGITTDTYDASGKITGGSDPSLVTESQLRERLDSFHGTIEQTPPMYSAIRHEGRHLYQLAREGVEVARKSRKVEIFRLELLDWQPPLVTIEVDCSAGTYIRSLAYDLGVMLGCGAHLRRLVRLRNEPFHIADSVPLPLIEEAFHQGCWQQLLYPIDEVILGWEAVTLSRENERMVRIGCSIPLDWKANPCAGARCRAYSADGLFLAVLRFQKEENLWHPDKVFVK